MKKGLFGAVLFTIFAVTSAQADITIEETTDAEYLINAGYSQTMVEDVFMQKNRVLGKPVEALYEAPTNAVVRTWRRFFSYLDPAQETQDKLHHDIKMSPSVTDL